MTIALVQSRPTASYVSTYAGTLTDAFATPPAIGSVVVVACGGYNSETTFAVSDSSLNTWTVIQNSPGDTTLAVAYAVITASAGPFEVTITGMPRSATMQISEWSGIASPTTAGNYAVTGGSPLVREAATTVAGQLAITAAGGNGTGGSYSTPSTYTALDGDILANCMFYTAYKLCGSPATETAEWTGTPPTDSDGSILVTFMPATALPPMINITGGTCNNLSGTANFVVSLDPATPLATDVTFTFNTGDVSDTATAGTDFTARSSVTGTIVAGQTSVNIPVTILP